VGDLPVQSISGGTDIIGCFVLGNPNRAVQRGWIQSRSLGMDVQALPDGGGEPAPGVVGELICELRGEAALRCGFAREAFEPIRASFHQEVGLAHRFSGGASPVASRQIPDAARRATKAEPAASPA